MAYMIPEDITVGGIRKSVQAYRQEWREALASAAPEPWQQEAMVFMLDFTGPGKTVTLHTSGTTGTPAYFEASKETLAASAALTLQHLGLHAGDRALLCLPAHYIAGKMMIVRAFLGGLDLWLTRPSSRPAVAQTYTFAAMTPMQTAALLETPGGSQALQRIRILLLGGGPLPPSLEEKLAGLPTEIYHTYGMTETFSHIALRRITGPYRSGWFEPLPGITVTLSEEKTLVVHAPHLSDKPFTTHDLAVMDKKGRFRITGRSDNIINSGGIKISPEEIEERLAGTLPWTFFVGSIPDPSLGERLSLIIMKPQLNNSDLAKIREAIKNIRQKIYRPSRVVATTPFSYTDNGKLQRKETLVHAFRHGKIYTL